MSDLVYISCMEWMRHIKADQEEKAALRKEGKNKNEVIQQKEEHIQELEEKAQLAEEHRIEEIEQLKLIHSSEIKQL